MNLIDLPGLTDLSGLHFLRPLWFLAMVPLPWLLWRLKRLDPGAAVWQGVVDAHLMPYLLVGTDARIRRLPLVLLACGWLLGVTALAGPVWERLPQPLYQAQAQRVIVLDLSPDMDAQDLVPSRLARARFEILDLLTAAAEGQTALLAYGAEPFLVSPLTGDAATIATQVPDLATALLPVKGAKRTDLALAEAGELLKRAGSIEGDIILITAAPGRPEAVRSMAANLRDQGYRTSVLGLGTASGAPVPQADGGFQSDEQGAIRLSRLQPDQLRAIAAAGGGSYVTLAADDGDTRALLPEARLDASNPKREQDARADQWREEGPWLLLAVLPLAALVFRRGWLSPLALLLVVCFAWVPPPAAHAFGWADLWWRPDQQGARALAAGDSQQAAASFARPDWRAAAQYEAGDFDQAAATLKDQTSVEADYNRGNALARAGKLSEAVAAYERTLAAAPDHADARFNLDLVQRLLAQQSAQSQESSSSSSQGEGGEEGADTSDDPIGGKNPEAGPEPAPRTQQNQQGQPDSQGRQRQQDRPDQQGQQGRGGPQGQEGPEGQENQGGQEDEQGHQGQQGQQARQGQDSQPGEPGEQGQMAQTDAGEAPAGGRQEPQDLGGEREPLPQQNQALAQPGNDRHDPQDQKKAGHPQYLEKPESAHPVSNDLNAEQNPRHPPQGRSAEPQPGVGPPSDQQAGAEPGARDLLGGQGVDQPPRGKPAVPQPPPMSEAQQALEAQLRRVPDDPGGLLRQRFLLQHLRRQGQLP